MRILIDTHILIWHVDGDTQLSVEPRNLLTDPTNSVLISITSIWEIAIKSSPGKLSLSRSIEEIVTEIDRSSISFLSIRPQDAIQVSKLPFHHKDPFDRMIVEQALVERIPVMSTDNIFEAYGAALL